MADAPSSAAFYLAISSPSWWADLGPNLLLGSFKCGCGMCLSLNASELSLAELAHKLSGLYWGSILYIKCLCRMLPMAAWQHKSYYVRSVFLSH